MIFDARKWSYRLILLSARNAARRFVSYSSTSSVRWITWKPLVLRWRKRTRNLRTHAPKPLVQSTVNLSFPQFHFHFPSFSHLKGKPDVPFEFPSVMTLRERSAIRNRYFTNRTVVVSPGDKPKEESRLSRETGSIRDLPRDGTWMKSGFSGSADASSTRANITFARPHVTLPKSEVRREPTVSQASGFERGETTSAGSATQRNSHKNSLESTFPAVVRFRSKRSIPDVLPTRIASAAGRPLRLRESRRLGLNLASLPSMRIQWFDARSVQPPDANFAVPVRRTDELIWRRTAQTMSDVVKRVSQLEISQEQEVAAARSAAVRHEIVPIHSAATAPLASINQLDPSLVDRLADHVIRKVDKRMRIERERRGL